MFKFKQSDLNQVYTLRNHYLDSLPEAQELFLELMIPKAKIYLIRKDNLQIGYFIRSANNVILEFYLIDNYLPFCNSIFKDVLEKYAIPKAYCKSFDSLLLKACLHNKKSVQIVGILYRNFVEKEIPASPNIKEIRTANMGDFDELSIISQDLFDTSQELEDSIMNSNILVFANEIEIIGCGLYHRVIKDKNSFDIGMSVAPNYRKQGYGSYIISYLKTLCLKNNWLPTCGCDVENIGSQKTLEKAGFVSKYDMLEFNF